MTRSFIIALFLLVACKKAEKPPLRTEPWPAPAAVSVPSSPKSSGVVRYTFDQGSAHVELKSRRTRVEGTLTRLEGEIELDSLHVEKTRAELRADLLTLDFEDPTLDSHALRALEIGVDVPSEDRDRDRWVRLRILGFQNKEPSDGTRRSSRSTKVAAFAELTLHRFRVPIPVELEVELSPDPSTSLRVRTRRPILVDLKAHNLTPVAGARPADLENFTEARVSAELSFRPAGFMETLPNKP